ncbi:MAG: hypothetical protein U0326_29900 [Polyangiales bacterium]
MRSRRSPTLLGRPVDEPRCQVGGYSGASPGAPSVASGLLGCVIDDAPE